MEGSLVVILFIAALIGIFWWSAAQQAAQERRIRALQLADIDRMPGLDFEHYVARLYRHRGYTAQVTNGSGDLGVDVIASKWGERLAVQVKRHSKPVSRRAVSDAVAGKLHYKCNAAVVVTNNFFSRGAIELAHSTGCQLVDRNMLADWIIAFQNNGPPEKPQPKQVQPSLMIEIEWPPAPLDEPSWEKSLDEAKERLAAAGAIEANADCQPSDADPETLLVASTSAPVAKSQNSSGMNTKATV